MIRGGAIIFFAYIGFDAVSTTAQEAKDPQRDMPFGILVSLGICTLLYMLAAGIMVGLAPYGVLRDNPAPMVAALDLCAAGASGAAASWLGVLKGLRR